MDCRPLGSDPSRPVKPRSLHWPLNYPNDDLGTGDTRAVRPDGRILPPFWARSEMNAFIYDILLAPTNLDLREGHLLAGSDLLSNAQDWSPSHFGVKAGFSIQGTDAP